MNKRKLIDQLVENYDSLSQLLGDIETAYHERHDNSKPTFDYSDKPIIVDLKNVSKQYKVGKTKINAVSDVSLKIHEGEMVALLGKSGSGKSTLLHMLGGLDKPDSGSIVIDGVDITKLRDGRLSRYRGQKIGFVFQSFYLQPFLNVQSNVEMPALFARSPRADRRKYSAQLLKAVGLDDRMKHYGKELSGGQIQRTAIARALMNKPKLIIADEPTGNLDQQTSEVVMELFKKARRDFGATVVVVTHDEDIARTLDRSIRIVDGSLA